MSGLLDNLKANRALLTYLAILFVFLFLTIRLRSAVRALLSLVPVLVAVGAASLFAWILQLKLSPMTAVAGPLVVAACTEFTSLILLRFVEERRRGFTPREAVTITASHTGRAFIVSALTAVAGVAVIATSSLPLLRDFGAVVALNVAVALLSALIVLPPLLVWADRRNWVSRGLVPADVLERSAARANVRKDEGCGGARNGGSRWRCKRWTSEHSHLNGLQSLIGPERARRFDDTAAAARAALAGRTVLNVNSTATGGGVAELLQTLLAYARGVRGRHAVGRHRGRPAVLRDHEAAAQPPVRDVGRRRPARPGRARRLRRDDSQQHLGRARPRPARATSSSCTIRRPRDSPARRRGRACTSCGDAMSASTPRTRNPTYAWEFLRPYVEDVDGYVFSREQFAPTWVPRARLGVIAPSIDPFSAKNEAMDPAEVIRLLQYVGLLAGDAGAA